jgi:hypothetical protein
LICRPFWNLPVPRAPSEDTLRSAVVFSQGDPATDVFYVRQGSIKLSVLSRTGSDAGGGPEPRGFLW